MTEYLLSQRGAEELERERLALLEEVYDPWTIRQLDAIGVEDGWRCLDAGAGGGSVTRMLAERVGSSGSVLAIDLDVGLLEPLASERVEVRRHDLMSDLLEDSGFDLVHARLLLEHLPSRLGALRRLISAARPGGWIAVADVDFTRVELSPPNHLWGRTWSAFCDALVAGGWDLRYGARLCPDLRALQLTDLEADYHAAWQRGGAPIPRLFSLTLERLRASMLAAGAAGEDIDQAQRMLRDRSITFRGPALWAARARRPAPVA